MESTTEIEMAFDGNGKVEEISVVPIEREKCDACLHSRSLHRKDHDCHSFLCRCEEFHKHRFIDCDEWARTCACGKQENER